MMITRLLLLALSVSFGLSCVRAEAKKVEFLPEVEALFEVQPLNTARLEQNLFVALSGLTFPRDNYATIYAEVLRHNYEKIAQSLNEGTFNTIKLKTLDQYLMPEEKQLELWQRDDENKYVNYGDYFSCLQYLNRQCVEETVDKQALIQYLLSKNSVLLARYETLLEHATHFDLITYPDRTFKYDEFALYRNEYKISSLQLAKAILLLKTGQFDEGIALLTYERSLLELILNPVSSAFIIDIAHVISRMQRLDQTLNGLLEAGFLDAHLTDPRIDHLFSPYTQAERQAVFRAYKREAFNDLSPIYRDQLKHSSKDQSAIVLSDADKLLALIWRATSFGDSVLIPHLAHEVTVLNQKYEDSETLLSTKMQQILEQLAQDDNLSEEARTKKVQAELAAYFSAKGMNASEIMDYFNGDTMITFYNQLYTSRQHYLAALEQAPFSEHTEQLAQDLLTRYPFFNLSNDYAIRMAEQSNYHQLVYLKYRIERDQINDADIPGFLESMGEQAWHPITQAPYLWDAKERTLSIPLAAKKFQPVFVKSNNKATHFKVWIK